MEDIPMYTSNSRPDAGFGTRNQTTGGHVQSEELKEQYKKEPKKLEKDQSGNDELLKRSQEDGFLLQKQIKKG